MKLYYKFAIAASIAFGALACAKDDLQPNPDQPGGENKEPEKEELVLSVSKTDVVLSKEQGEQVVLKFEWTALKNPLDIIFSITSPDDPSGEITEEFKNDFASMTSIEYKGMNLNTQLSLFEKAKPGVKCKYEAQVKSDKYTSNVVTFYVTRYDEQGGSGDENGGGEGDENGDGSGNENGEGDENGGGDGEVRYLYMVGDATSGGWTIADATPLPETESGSGIYQWTGNLKVGSIKFPTTTADWWPAYVKDASASDESTLIYYESFPGDDKDRKFLVDYEGEYTVTVNTTTLKLDLQANFTPAPVEKKVYLIGDATPCGWTVDNPIEMTKLSESTFTWTGTLTYGEFRFITNVGAWWPGYVKDTENEGKILYDKEGVHNVSFDVTTSGDYTISIDTDALTISIQLNAEAAPYRFIAPIGTASPNSWDLSNAASNTSAHLTPVSSNSKVYEGTLTLTAGELKFTCDGNTNWDGGVWISPTAADASWESGNILVRDFDKNSDHTDLKWKLTDAGVYKVSLDLGASTITITQAE